MRALYYLFFFSVCPFFYGKKQNNIFYSLSLCGRGAVVIYDWFLLSAQFFVSRRSLCIFEQTEVKLKLTLMSNQFHLIHCRRRRPPPPHWVTNKNKRAATCIHFFYDFCVYNVRMSNAIVVRFLFFFCSHRAVFHSFDWDIYWPFFYFIMGN